MRVRAKLGWLLLLAISIPAVAKRASDVGLIRLEPIQQIVEGLDAWPLIINPKNDAERRINGTLSSFNSETRKALAECKGDDEWSREVRVTMTGPRYLSLQASGEIFCGGVHPDPYDAALVFDLAIGKLVDGSTIVENNSEIKTVKTTEISHYPQSDKFLISSPALDSMLMASANDNCKESLQEVVHNPRLYRLILYSVWPDAENNHVVVKPVNLSYLDYLMCSEEVDISVDQARKLGFSKSFLQAIDKAHSRLLRP